MSFWTSDWQENGHPHPTSTTSPLHLREVTDTDRANAIREFLHGNIDGATAAVTFTSDINASTTKDQAQGGLWQIWALIENICLEFPEKHEQVRLIHLASLHVI